MPKTFRPGGGNLLMRHSELAVTLWIAYQPLYANKILRNSYGTTGKSRRSRTGRP